MRAEDLINKLGAEEKDLLRNREVFSPYFPTVGTIVTRIGGMIYRFKISKRDKVGFGIFKPKNPEFAHFRREASEEQVEKYLSLLPQVKGILVFKTDFWYCISQNASAYVKIGFNGLCEAFNADNIEALDYFVGRFDGQHVWFENLDPNCDIEKVELLKERAKKHSLGKIKGLTPEDEAAFKLIQKKREEQIALTMEGRLGAVFTKKGVKFDSFKERGNEIEVKWKTRKGQPYTTWVKKKDFSIVSAGICLAHEDTKFDLSSLIGVVEQGEDRALIHRTGRNQDYL